MATPMDTGEVVYIQTEDDHRCDIDYNSKIGHGGFGIVYRAKNKRGELVACKVIDYQTQEREEYRKIAESEAKKSLQIGCGHPNIVHIYDAYEENRKAVIVMEFCSFSNLDVYLTHNNTLPLKNRVILMAQIAEGIRYLHGRGIIHRDIKPQNILIQKRKEDHAAVAKISDFGIAKFLEGLNSTMQTDVGNHAYKAPEFWQKGQDGKIHYRKSVDVFALGLTFLAMLQTDENTQRFKPHIEVANSLDHSERSFDIGYTMSVRLKHSQSIPNIIQRGGEGMAKEVRDLIRKMIEVDPQLRPSAEDVCAGLHMIPSKYP